MGAKGPSAGNAVGNQGALQKGALGGGQSAINPAINYYQGVLAGGPQAQQAVAPAAQQISQVYSQQQKNEQNLLPQGGERNLALAQLPIQRAGQIASLYQGVQPAAAQALSGIGTNLLGLGGQAGQGLVGYQGQQNAQKGAALGGLGQGLGQLGGKALGNWNPGGLFSQSGA